MRHRLPPLLALVCVALSILISIVPGVSALWLGAWSAPGVGVGAQEPEPALPAVPVVPPIAPELMQRLTGDLGMVMNDISFDNRRFRVRVPYLRVTGGGRGDGSMRLSLVHVRGAQVVSTASDIVIPIDLFTNITDQRIDVARVLVENSAITRRLRSGVVQWYFRGVDMDVRDIALGGARAEGLRVVRADGAGEVDAKPVTLRSLTARARRERMRGSFVASADAQLGATHAELAANVRRGAGYTIDVSAQTTDYGELHAFVDALPRAGSGAIEATVAKLNGVATIDITRADAQLNTSHVAARGVVRTGAGGHVDDVIIDIERILAADLDTAYGVELPGGGEVRGRVTASGPLREGVNVVGALHRVAAADSTMLRLHGTVRDTGRVLVDVLAHAEPVRAVDTLFVVALRAHGPLDSLAVTGDASLARTAPVLANGDVRDPELLRDARATLDAIVLSRDDTRVLRGSVELSATMTDRATGRAERVGGDIAGVVALEKGGRIEADMRADSLPLRLLPAPDAVRDVRGVATGALRITGTIDEPHWTGAVEVSGGGLRVQRFGTMLDDVRGTIRITDDVASTDGISGQVGGGPLAIAGTATLRGARTIDATLRLDRGRILDNDSLRATASAELRATGALSAPTLRGQVTVHDGHFDEDMLKEPAPLDVRAPPYADVAARVPWLRESKLLRPDTARASSGLPADIALELRVERGFRIIDEDSEMSGTGLIVFTTDSATARDTGAGAASQPRRVIVANGSYRIERGEYNNFGERFRVQGGIFHFPGDGFRSRVSLRGRHDPGAPIGRDLGTDGSALDYYPPLESFAIGSLSGIKEEVRRTALLPQQPSQLGSALLYREPAEPVTGWRANRYWQADAGASLVGARARAQSTPLLWAYTGDEAYDWLPLSNGYLRAGSIAVGPPFPGRMVVAGVIGGGVRSGALELDVRQPLEGGEWPGLQLRHDRGPWRLTAFNEPRFHAATSGYLSVRRNGVRVLWRTDW